MIITEIGYYCLLDKSETRNTYLKIGLLKGKQEC